MDEESVVGGVFAAPETLSSPNQLLVVAALRMPRDLLGLALATHLPDWQVFTAADPQQAFEVCDRPSPTVALLDIGGDRSLLQWGALLLQHWPQLPVVVLDNALDDAAVRLTLSLGLVGYITRDQPLSTLVASLPEAALGRRVFSPEVSARLRVTASGLSLVDDRPTPWSQLTARERDVLSLIAQGHSVASTAKLLGISPATVDNHKTRVMQKLGIHKATQLATWALSVGLISSPATGKPLANPIVKSLGSPSAAPFPTS